MPDSDFSTRALLKWQLVGLLEYSYVFYTDIDTDLFFDTAGAPRFSGTVFSARGGRDAPRRRGPSPLEGGGGSSGGAVSASEPSMLARPPRLLSG